MTEYKQSKTFESLWKEILKDLFKTVLDKLEHISIDAKKIRLQCLLAQKFDEYREQSKEYMVGDRLDRHKLASCICAAIIEVKPLIYIDDDGSKSYRTINEIFAFDVGLAVIKFYMITELLLHEEDENFIKAMIKLIRKEFSMECPSTNENICDVKEYRLNIANAMKRTYKYCDKVYKNCFSFDIWAYAHIYYHLELYNKERLISFYNDNKDKVKVVTATIAEK